MMEWVLLVMVLVLMVACGTPRRRTLLRFAVRAMVTPAPARRSVRDDDDPESPPVVEEAPWPSPAFSGHFVKVD